MKIKVLEPNGILDGKTRYHFEDVVTVSDEDGAYFCGNGWAEDMDGKVATAQRTLHEVKLDIRGSKHGQQAEKLGE